jgi:DNA-binding response OmpR family regulator
MEAGFFDYLTKPIKVNLLMAAIDAALLLAQTSRGTAALQEPA